MLFLFADCFVSLYCCLICVCSWLSISFIAFAFSRFSFGCFLYFLCRIIAVVSIEFMVSSLYFVSCVSNSWIFSDFCLFGCCSVICVFRRSCVNFVMHVWNFR